MALPLWGELQKAQDDSRTIEEFIDDKIVEHEEDPEAHLGEGESLQAHKSESIIDHPAQSVVVDKQPFGVFDESSIIIGGYGWELDTGTFSPVGQRDIDLHLFSQTEVDTNMRLPWDPEESYPNADLLLRFRLIMNGAQHSDGTAYIRWVYYTGANSEGRVEFIKSGTSYYYRLYYEGELIQEHTLQTGGEFDAYIVLLFDYVRDRIELYVNGVLTKTFITDDNLLAFVHPTVQINAVRTTNTSIALTIITWAAKYTLYTS